MLIRSTRPDEVDAIARVRIASWHATYARIIPETFLDPSFIAQFVERRQRTLRDIEREEFIFVVADEPFGGIGGFADGCPALAPSRAYAGCSTHMVGCGQLASAIAECGCCRLCVRLV